jgi:glucose-6-phosphate 1-dehydrogenase
LFLRTGKHLCGRLTEIAICFKKAPLSPFQDTPVSALAPNWLALHVAPEEGVSLQFEARRPGPAVELAQVSMDFRYGDWFRRMPNVGYETLLYDVMIGDPTLFMRADMVEQCWSIVQPTLDAWARRDGAVEPYASGSCGPRAADELIARDGNRAWRPIAPPARSPS